MPDLACVIQIDVIANDKKNLGLLEWTERRATDVETGSSGGASALCQRMHAHTILGGDRSHQLMDVGTRYFLSVEGYDNTAWRKLVLAG